MKLFLKQFGVGAVILSSELDAKSRQNAVLQFNKGKYDVLIANDQADIDEEIVEGENEKVTFSAIGYRGSHIRLRHSVID